jgi:tryptophanyl-tRNA synthetase
MKSEKKTCSRLLIQISLLKPAQVWIFFLFLVSYKKTVMTDLSKDVQSLKLEGKAVKVAPADVHSTTSQNVTPWEVEGAVVDGVQQAIDYNKLIEQFGTRPIDEALLERFEKLTGRKAHIFLRRGTFFSHR